jgi:hypothetical protein
MLPVGSYISHLGIGVLMKIINRESSLVQGVVKYIKHRGLSPDEGAKRELRVVHYAFDQRFPEGG